MNKDIYKDEEKNAIRISELNAYSGEVHFSNVAAKFVLEGKETYIVNNKKFQVNKGEYIIGNNNQLSEVNINQNTVGLCIDISNDIIAEIIETVFDNPDLQEFLLTDNFLINKYNSERTNLGHKINQLSKELLTHHNYGLLSNELFYSIGENIVHDQALIFEQLSRLNYKKQEVSEDVFRNLLNTKNYIDDCFLNPINIADLMSVSLISKYAFIRQFKQTFGITPYHYILQKRLNYAKQKLLAGSKIVDLAIETNFADTASFSKAFKAHFGMSPSKFCK
jgi:AraC-like DNA-binding protein